MSGKFHSSQSVCPATGKRTDLHCLRTRYGKCCASHQSNAMHVCCHTCDPCLSNFAKLSSNRLENWNLALRMDTCAYFCHSKWRHSSCCLSEVHMTFTQHGKEQSSRCIACHGIDQAIAPHFYGPFLVRCLATQGFKSHATVL